MTARTALRTTVLLLTLALAAALAGPAAVRAQNDGSGPASGAASGTLPGPMPETAPGPADQTETLGSALSAMGKGNPVLARVDGHEIRFADVAASARDLPKSYQGQFETILPALLARLIDQQLLIDAGRAAGLADDPAVHRQVMKFEDRAVSEAFVAQKAAESIDHDALIARYAAYRKDLENQAEVRARHILLNSREDALAVIAALDQGADFATLARTRSIAPTAAQGGDMDYVSRGSMAPDFAAVAFGLAVGQYSPEPLHTEAGWDVIKVEDRREKTPRSFFDMRDELRQAATRDLLDRLLADMRRTAKIELFPQAPGTQ